MLCKLERIMERSGDSSAALDFPLRREDGGTGEAGVFSAFSFSVDDRFISGLSHGDEIAYL
jgi:hypothetical protein